MALDMTTALTIKANVKGEEELRGLQQGLNKLSGQSKKTATAMDRLKKASTGAMGAMKAFLPVLGVAAFAKLGNDVLQLGDKLEKMSGATGVSVPLLDKLRQSAALAGTDFKALQRAFPTLAKNMQDASDGIGTAKDAFDRLGFSVTDSNGNLKDLDTAFLELTDKFKGMEAGTMKAANAAEIFGTGLGRKLIPLLNQGSEAIDGLSTGFTQLSAERMAAFNDSMAQLGEKFRIVAIQVMEALLPALQTLVDILDNAAKIFNAIPGPIKQLVVTFGVFTVAVKALGVAAGITAAALKGIAALKIGGLISGWAGSIGPLVVAIKGIGLAIAAVFTAPAAPLVLAGLAVAGLVAALIKWRKEIGDFFTGMIDGLKEWSEEVGERWEAIRDKFKEKFVEPALELVKKFKDGTVKAFKGLADLVKAPFLAVWNAIKNIMNMIVQGIVKRINSVADAVNFIIKKINSIATKIKVPAIPLVPTISIPKFAKGGVVRGGATLAMVGEKEEEYIIPKSKMSESAMNWLSGKRGEAVIPAFASGGVVNSGGGYSSANVNINTGPVMQMEGQNYVTVSDLENALQTFSSSIFANSRSYGGRRFQGLS